MTSLLETPPPGTMRREALTAAALSGRPYLPKRMVRTRSPLPPDWLKWPAPRPSTGQGGGVDQTDIPDGNTLPRRPKDDFATPDDWLAWTAPHLAPRIHDLAEPPQPPHVGVTA